MKNRMKRALALMLCMLMCLALLPAGPALAEGDLTLEEITDEDLIRILDESDEDEIVIIDEEDGSGSAEKPEPVEGKAAYGFDGLYIEPLYRSVISEEQLAEQLRGAEASAELTAVPNAVKYCSSVSSAGIYLRGQMVKRSSSVSFLVPYDLYWETYDLCGDIYARAIIHSDSRSGQEGDALRWGSIGWGYSISYQYDDEHGECYQITYDFSWTTSSSQETKLTTKVDSVMSSLALDGKTEKQKVKAIHDYICDNVNYDYEHVDLGADYPLQFSAYAAMCQGTAVCQGYAILFYRMAKEAGLGVRVVTSNSHAWNIVRIGSVYYNIDTTWDGQDDETYHTWYLKGMRDFGEYNHLREHEYCTDEFWAAYPMVKESKLNLDNPEFSFKTTAGTTMKSTAASGTPRILIFNHCYIDDDYCLDSSASILQDFLDYKLDGVKVLVIDVNYNSKAQLKKYREAVGGSEASFCYDSVDGNWDAFSTYDDLSGGLYNTPLIVFIDGNNKIQDYRVGDYGPETLAGFVKTYLGVTLSFGPPRFSRQPESVTVADGCVFFYAEALGHDEISYQWYYRKNADDSWKKCTGYGSQSQYLEVEALKYRNGYQYRCKATNAQGYKYSEAATLSVKQLPVITSQPETLTKTLGYTAKFTVKASYAAKYQWYYRTGPSGSWHKSTLTGATTATLSVKATEARSGYEYRCKVSNADGYVYSDAATLCVVPYPVITSQPEHMTAAAGEKVKFTVKASGASKYQWYYRTSPTGSWTKSTLSGATTSTLTVEAKSSRSGYQYRCRLSNSNDGGYIYSRAATLTVGTVKYRALLVGEVNFRWDNATRNRGDVTNMKNMLDTVQGAKGGYYAVTCRYNLNGEALREAIATAFAGADSDDVSLFFIATHGVVDVASGPYAGELCLVDENGYEEFFLLSELAECLKEVPGKVIVLLGSCGSGAAILQNGTLRFSDDPSGLSDVAFNEAAIRVFADADAAMAVPNTGELRSSKFYVMTAAAHQESSWGYEYDRITDGHNLFPLYFSQGATGDKPADANGNGTITLSEMFDYVYVNCYNAGPFYEDGEYVYQHVQVYPENSSYALFK